MINPLSYMNWIDWLIIALVIYFAISGWEQGLLRVFTIFISYASSLWLAVMFYIPVGTFISEKFGFPNLWSETVGYFIVAVLGSIVIHEILKEFVSRLPSKFHFHTLNSIFGSFISIVNALIIVSFLLVLLSALPIRGTVKKDILSSRIGEKLIEYMQKYGGPLKNTLDTVTQKALQFTTVDPASRDRIILDITPDINRLVTVEREEDQMIELVNNERIAKGVVPLLSDKRLVEIARTHSTDMFIRRYFSHYDPDGHDVVYRLEQKEYSFTAAGENLAYAPDVMTAHKGLMNSAGHRKNILDPTFSRIGVGVIDSGIYGRMYTQIFAE